MLKAMQVALRPVMWLGVAGFCVSVVVHILALFGLPSPFGSATWLLHLGLFVVWLPTVLVTQQLAAGAKQKDLWKAALRGCPVWVRTGVKVVGGYAMVNFLLFSVQTTAYAKNQVPEIVELRGFSGHWMIFYYTGAAVLYSATRIGFVNGKCPRGHVVSPFANYCDVCGAALLRQRLTASKAGDSHDR